VYDTRGCLESNTGSSMIQRFVLFDREGGNMTFLLLLRVIRGWGEGVINSVCELA